MPFEAYSERGKHTISEKKKKLSKNYTIFKENPVQGSF